MFSGLECAIRCAEVRWWGRQQLFQWHRMDQYFFASGTGQNLQDTLKMHTLACMMCPFISSYCPIPHFLYLCPSLSPAHGFILLKAVSGSGFLRNNPDCNRQYINKTELNCTFYLMFHKIVTEDVESTPAYTLTALATSCHSAHQHSLVSLLNPSVMNSLPAGYACCIKYGTECMSRWCFDSSQGSKSTHKCFCGGERYK